MRLTHKITRHQLELFLAQHATTDRVLDIGSGGSSYHRFFPNRLSVDIDMTRKPDMIADAHALPFKDAEFTTIICTEVLEHLRDPRTAIAEMHRVLAPNGKLILTTRFIYPIHDAPHDYFRYTKYALKDMFAAFKDLTITPETTNFTTLAVLIQRICYQTELRGGKVTKGLFFIFARIVASLNWLITEEYGDIKKSVHEHDIFASGYYLTAIKP